MQDHQIRCFERAVFLVESGCVKLTDEMDIFGLSDLLIKLEEEKEFKNNLSDKSIDYNDAIISIEDIGILDTVDISVSGDNLFYCNNILTKNSFGLPATADLMFALISTEELEALGQIMVKQLKNRYSDLNYYKRFVIGVDRAKMKLFDVEASAQSNISDKGTQDKDKPAFDNSESGKRIHSEGFDDFKF
jgi:hypothetical protein